MDKFKWVDCNDAEGQTLSFLKFGDRIEDTLLIACNFSDQKKHQDWGCPHDGLWEVIFDSDSTDYFEAGIPVLVKFSHKISTFMTTIMD